VPTISALAVSSALPRPDRDDHLALAVLAPERPIERVEAVDVGDWAASGRSRPTSDAPASFSSRASRPKPRASGKVTRLAFLPRSTAGRAVQHAGAEVHGDGVVVLPGGHGCPLDAAIR
jgi:hypothetical protein